MGEQKEQTEHEKALTSAVPVLGGGSALTALSTTQDGTAGTIMIVFGTILIILGAVMLGRAMKRKTLEEG